jgi:hypothetical protein
VAAVSQGVRAASGSVSSAGALAPAGSLGPSSAGGAPWNCSTVAPPVDSAQGKDSKGLAEAWGQVVGGKRGRGRLREGGHLLSSSQRASALSLALYSERRRGAALSHLRVGCGGEKIGVRD